MTCPQSWPFLVGVLVGAVVGATLTHALGQRAATRYLRAVVVHWRARLRHAHATCDTATTARASTVHPAIPGDRCLPPAR